jgi:hypothetical protein
MAEEADPIRTLATAREKLIEERRALAVTIALGYRRRRADDTHANETRGAFVEIQDLIEAMDRAIAHEKTLAGRSPELSTVPNLEIMPSAHPVTNSRQ